MCYGLMYMCTVVCYSLLAYIPDILYLVLKTAKCESSHPSLHTMLTTHQVRLQLERKSDVRRKKKHLLMPDIFIGTLA